MSHYQQIQFCKILKKNFYKDNKISILEIGSYNVNGSLRDIFNNINKYVGLDLIKGPGVDKVYDGKNMPINECFDLCISCECFEHNPHYLNNFLKMIEFTENDGLVAFTCATIGRAEHGTADSDGEVSNSPGSMKKWNYYKNLTKKNFSNKIDLNKHFYKFMFFNNTISSDLYFVGIKSEKFSKEFLDFKNEILGKNSLVVDLQQNFHEKSLNKIKYLFKNIFPLLIGDFLSRKLQIKLKKIFL